jgi:hypothetical protein
MDEAWEALEDLLAFRPWITERFIREHYPSVIHDSFDHLLNGLRKAGLPE